MTKMSMKVTSVVATPSKRGTANWILHVFTITVIIIGSFCSGAAAVDWKPWSENDQFYGYYDEKSVTHPSQGFIRVWVMLVDKVGKGKDQVMQDRIKRGLSIKGYDDFSYVKYLWEIDCSNRKFSLIDGYDYNKEGEALDKTVTTGKWLSIPPGSPTELLHKTFCQQK